MDMRDTSPTIRRAKGSAHTGALSRGCVLCGEGAKMVLFITGLCSHGCFYCPLSEKKSGKDVSHANERQVVSIREVLEEAVLMDVLGTGITGGDPLLVLRRTLRWIEELKVRFGPEHHIHLYTRTPASRNSLVKLRDAGLDEIRYHIPPEDWSGEGIARQEFGDSMGAARELKIDCGLEIPVFPDMRTELTDLCKWGFQAGAEFINLNELEMNYINHEELLKKDYFTASDISSAVKGSGETGERIIEHFSRKGNFRIHLCTVSFKDGVQLKNRIGRRALNVMRPYHEMTEDNTLVRALIECAPTDENIEALMNEFEIPGELIDKDMVNSCITTAWYIAEELNPVIPYRCAIIEEYPTFDRLEVERRYLEKKQDPHEKPLFYEKRGHPPPY